MIKKIFIILAVVFSLNADLNKDFCLKILDTKIQREGGVCFEDGLCQDLEPIESVYRKGFITAMDDIFNGKVLLKDFADIMYTLDREASNTLLSPEERNLSAGKKDAFTCYWFHAYIDFQTRKSDSL